MIDPTDLFEAVRTYDRSADNEESKGHARFATLDASYSGSGPARVTFDGETTLSTKSYHWVGNSPPRAGTRVFVLPVSTTYVIVGMVNGGV